MKEMSKEDKEKLIQDYIAERNKKKEIMNDIMHGTKYIKWLIQFTKAKEGFSSEDWLYFPEELSDYDRKNVELLGLFYHGIEKYADQNYIYPIPCDFGYYYNIKINKIGFEIGVLVGQGTVFFCNKTPIKKDKSYINFKDIMIGKRQENAEQIDISLEALSKMIENIYNNGVPIEAINDTYNKTINDITSNNTNTKKKVKKKDEISNE